MASNRFTIEINYEGVFVPKPLTYYNAVVKVVDDIDFASLDFTEFHGILRKLTGAKCQNVYYCIPRLSLCHGLRMLKSEEEYASFIENGYENGNRISVYLDHYSENLNDWIDEEKTDEILEVDIGADYDGLSDYDSVSDDGIEEELSLQKVCTDLLLNGISPNEVLLQVEEEESDTDEGKSDTASLNEDYEEFDAPKGVVYPRYDPTQCWKDMKPVLGMKFESPKQLKQCLCNYGVANGYQLWFEKNDYKRLLVRCGKGNDNVRCPFRLWASWMGGEETFQIKSLNSNHNCSRNFKLGSIVSYTWIGNHFVNEILENPKMSVNKLQEEVKKRFNIQVSASQCRRAKSYAKNEIEGSLNDHYTKLWSYAEEIRRSNPGSTAKMDVETMPDGTTYFSKFYVCFKGLKDGWKEGCRRVIGLDGSFLKGICKGELLSAVGRDANNHIYPIAWAVVSVENKANWKWFVDLLIEDLSLETGTGLTIISDQHKGLVESVKELLPLAEHRQCTRHIYANFKKRFNAEIFRTLFWRAASSTTEAGFKDAMLEIKSLSTDAYNHLIERDPRTWCKAFFEVNRACDAFENGISESFNSRTEKARKNPILGMLEEIRLIVMNQLYKRKIKGQKWDLNVCPKIRKKLEKLKEQQRWWGVYPSGLDQFEVRNGNEAYQVDINEKTCSCRMWQLSGIACVHSMAAVLYLNRDSEKFVSFWFSREMFLNTYQFTIRPMNGMTMWPSTEYINPLPPKARRMPGRPAVKRKRHASEIEGKHSLSKAGKTVRCGLCKEVGHNRAKCKDAQKNIGKKSKKGKKIPVVKEHVQDQEFVEQPSEEPFVEQPSEEPFVEQQSEQPFVEQHVEVPGPSTRPHIMFKMRKRSERIMLRKISEPVYDRDGGGRSIEQPVDLD